MLYWIFDLDLTLYQLPINVNFDYKHLTKDDQLNYLLTMLPCKKILFTNGTYNHAINCLNKIDIKDKFMDIVARDTINDLKPRNTAFNSFLKINNINVNDKCVFFDDQVNNLVASKKYGWNTVLISSESILNDDIDFQFNNIYLAINYFLSKILINNK
jgi:FMN phosphatase YigB (HAD superfamily)